MQTTAPTTPEHCQTLHQPCAPPDKQAFALIPCEGGVPPGESVTVKATFSPDYSRVWPFLGAFRIEVRDQVRWKKRGGGRSGALRGNLGGGTCLHTPT